MDTQPLCERHLEDLQECRETEVGYEYCSSPVSILIIWSHRLGPKLRLSPSVNQNYLLLYINDCPRNPVPFYRKFYYKNHYVTDVLL